MDMLPVGGSGFISCSVVILEAFIPSINRNQPIYKIK